MQCLLIGVAIDVLKWMREPLRRLEKAIGRLRRKWCIDYLVSLQFKHHRLKGA